MSTITQDLRYALRTLGKSPIFTLVAILSLALGIGANTALFSFMDRLLLRSLPVQDPELLTLLDSPGPHVGRVENSAPWSWAGYKEIRDENQVFSGVLARYEAQVSVTYRNSTDLAQGELVSGNYFDVLGLKPAVGRFFTPEEDRVPGANYLAVLGHGYWQRKFGGDASIIGQKLLINGHPFEVLGVAPPRFEGVLVGQEMEIFVPVTMKAQITPTFNGLDQRSAYFLNIFARLKPGVTREAAQRSLEPLYARMVNEDIDAFPGLGAQIQQRLRAKRLLVKPGYQGRSTIRQRLSTPLVVLMGMVGLVLLIACANLANLLIARAASRQKEIAIRLSLGASRADLVRQLLTESSVIAFTGGTLGILVAVWAGDLLASYTPGLGTGPGRPDWSVPDGRVLAFNFAISAITAVLFGLIPAWKATRPQVAATLKDQAGAVASSIGDVRLRKGLVIAQIALSLLLLFGATLFARSLKNLRTLDPGLSTENLLTFSVDPSLSGYQKDKALAVLEQVRQSVSTLPGVRAASLTDNPVLADNISMTSVNIEGYQRKDGEQMSPQFAQVGPGFFQTMGTRILLGREFDERDGMGAPKVAVINSTFAKRWFPNQNPLGRKIALGRRDPDHTIIGVVADQRHRNMREDLEPMYYYPYLQNDNPGYYAFYVRATGNPSALGNAIRREVARISGTMPVFEMRTMEAQLDQVLNVERVIATISGFFGLLAAVLAAIGLYGVMAYTVTRRTREIGIRMALGAERNQVLWMVLREVAIMACIGILVGVPAALALSRYVQTQLYGLTPNDPVTMAISVAAMTAIALLAGFLPASRASRVNPIRALRYE